ncbi:hypothetical protein CL653_02860 [bacterium]|nr:hypothetical protein [bacterium]|tara:strand:+ start:1004 stop:1753 length:750 start_codon:yes stop_codon:yes gene_type:complete
MIISYPNGHRWRKPVIADPLQHFGKSNRARVRSTLNRVHEYDVKFAIEELSADFFTWFKPLYESHIGAMQNGKIYDIEGTTLYKENSDKKYYSITLYEKDRPTGGTIFSCLEDMLSFAYRVYGHDWVEAKLPASPSFYMEYITSKYAYDIGLKTISHGKDRNPYGLNSAIGLGMFKLSVGCKPLLPKKYEISTIDTDQIQTDALIFEMPNRDDVEIKKAYLVAKEANLPKYLQLLKYDDFLKIETILRQ